LRRNWTTWLSAVVLAALAAAVPAHAAQTATRIFAMQPKLDLSWMQSRQTYHDKLFALADRKLRGPPAPLIQAGADDFASHLRSDGRNLVVWPEDIGLWAALTGQRGANARGSGSLVGAVVTLFGAYAPQMTWYGQKYPAVAGRAPQVRLLALALTDTFARVAVETLSEMAAKYHVWLEAGVDMAQSWHVVCTTADIEPPQEPCDEVNAAKVAALGDPGEPSRGYAYEATSPDVSNMALVFDPSGKLVSKQVKTYITPIELGQDEGQLAALDLVPGSVTSGLTAVQTPVGTLGFVTSKDAWMPDVLDRLEEEHVDLLVQPEFFVGDLAAPTGMWAADTLKASGYNDLLRHSGFDAMALPSAVGNVFDFSADEQSQIAIRPGVPRGGGVTLGQTGDKWLIGQPPAPGLAAVAPWAVPDPLNGQETFAQRRKRLGEVGQKLAPGSGVRCPDPAKPGACENGNVETVVWQDVSVGTPAFKRFRGKRLRTRFARSRAIGSTAYPERNPAIALAGRFGALAYERRRAGHDGVLVAATSDGGRHWTRPAQVGPSGRADEQWPAVAVSRDGNVTLAWGTDASGPSRVLYAQGRIRSRHVAFGPPHQIDPAAPATSTQWKPALAQAGDVVHAAFVDTRTRFGAAPLPQAGVYYTRIANGVAAPAVRMDEGPPDALAAKLDNAWAPSVAARGADVLVTWIDFMHYDWDVLSRISHDDGKTFAAQVDSNPERADVEDLSDSPSAVLTSRGPLIAWTDFHKRDSAATTPHEMYDIYAAAPGEPPLQADPFATKQVSTFWPSTCVNGRDTLLAFQDSSTGVARVRVERLRRGAKRGHAFLVSDTRANAYRPSIACARGRVTAAWEDARDGPTRIYLASAPLRAIR
jgi:predicted amidohydrolase